MMRTINKYTTALAAAALFAAACSSDKTETPLPPSSDKPICWNVKMEDGTARSTRYLIGNASDAPATSDPTDPAYYLPLEEACKPEAEGGKYGYAVGLFGDYTYTEGGKEVTVYDLFRGTRLVSSENKSDNPNDPKWVWKYESAAKYWHPGAEYIFRAYYPQRLYNYTISTSNATTLGIVYPTRKQQYDLLLGCTTVVADAEQMEKAVDITMDHALAALRFNFRLGFADEDWLTSVYLLNDEKRQYFSQGTVAYGDLPTVANPTDVQIEKARKSVKWLPDYNPPATEELYKWVPPETYWNADDAEQLKKDGTNPVYMKSELVDNKVISKYKASAYYGKPKTEDADDAPVVGEIYCRNSGWLLIIPQESHGTLSVCFTTKKGGKTVYKVALPAETEKDKDGNPIYEWKAGKRYTYTITLSRSDLGIDVEVKEWNRRNHSTEIVF